MSLLAELTVDGKVFKVRRYYTLVKRKEDIKGRPASDPTWRIFLLIDSSDDQTMTNWMLDPRKKIDGKLTLYNIEGLSTYKEIQFKKSSCFKLRDYFNAGFSFPTTFIAISGKDIKINTASLEQRWPGA